MKTKKTFLTEYERNGKRYAGRVYAVDWSSAERKAGKKKVVGILR